MEIEVSQSLSSTHRTYLCPDCDGWGRTGGRRIDVDDFEPEYTCLTCDESGVVRMERAQAERLGLQPWSGNEGRRACSNRRPEPDLLYLLKQARQHARCSWGAGRYGAIRQRVISPLNCPLPDAPKPTLRQLYADLHVALQAAA